LILTPLYIKNLHKTLDLYQCNPLHVQYLYINE
jgi:hypothetical protein